MRLAGAGEVVDFLVVRGTAVPVREDELHVYLMRLSLKGFSMV